MTVNMRKTRKVTAEQETRCVTFTKKDQRGTVLEQLPRRDVCSVQTLCLHSLYIRTQMLEGVKADLAGVLMGSLRESLNPYK